jgi:aspartate aminotransferase
MKLASRVSLIKPSPTLVITTKAASLRAQGKDVIDFGVGEPDFNTPDNIKAAAIQAVKTNFTRYTAVGGIDELKDAIIRKLETDNHLSYKRSEIVVSCGPNILFSISLKHYSRKVMRLLLLRLTGFPIPISSFLPGPSRLS